MSPSSSSPAGSREATRQHPPRWRRSWRRTTPAPARGSPMLAPDINVLVYAHRLESPDHARYAEWLTQLATGAEPFGLSDLVCSGFVRIVTNPRIWRPPTEPAVALSFVDRLRRRRGCRLLSPGTGTWTVFSR